MKREVLFRAYQKNFKRMLPVTSIEFEYNNNEIDKIARENQSGMFGRIQSELFELYKENKEFGNLKEARQCLLSIGKLYSLVD